MIEYSVYVSFQDEALAVEWLAWMRHGHVKAVCEAGAIRAELFSVQNDRAGKHYVARYIFKSENDFKHYEEYAAPKLRSEGLKMFPVEMGVTYQRSTARMIQLDV